MREPLAFSATTPTVSSSRRTAAAAARAINDASSRSALPLSRRRAGAIASLATLSPILPFSRLSSAARAAEGEAADGTKGGRFFTKFLQPPWMEARSLISSGMGKFLGGDVGGSVDDFNRALELDPSIKPRLWQRGLSLYYDEQYEKAAEQFRADVSYNPNDTEEALWTYLSEAQIVGSEKAKQRFLRVGEDPRPLLRIVYDTFRESEPQGAEGADPSRTILDAGLSSQSPHDEFYSLLYASLYNESVGKAEAARGYMKEAIETEYATKSGDYMAGLANVHYRVRKWNSSS